jgi:hypothetical protein
LYRHDDDKDDEAHHKIISRDKAAEGSDDLSRIAVLARISLVDDTFSASRNSVVMSRMVGRMENSRGFLMYSVVMRMKTDAVILTMSSTSRTADRSGMMISITTMRTTPAINTSAAFI